MTGDELSKEEECYGKIADPWTTRENDMLANSKTNGPEDAANVPGPTTSPTKET